ncbi:hypothetical protein [Williamsia sterculiae]|nr:hypothetical protein [Williamsia sterculiae]
MPEDTWVFHPGANTVSGPESPPAVWAAAIAAVSRDLPLMQTGADADAWNATTAQWTLSIADGNVSVEVRDSGGVVRIDTTRLGRLQKSAASATVWTARLVQHGLADTSDIAWPTPGGTILLMPHAVYGTATWMVNGTSISFAPIGDLGVTPLEGSLA